MNAAGTALTASVTFVLGALATTVPEVEDPIPDTIGLGLIFAVAAAGGVLGAVIGAFDRFRDREHTRSWWTNTGIAVGFFTGLVIYLAAAAYQVLF